MYLDSQTFHPSTLRVHLFGGLRIDREGRPIRLPTRKAELLLAYLILHPESHSREKLAALFWGYVPDEQARGSLRKALTSLRNEIGRDILRTDRQTVRLNPDFPLWVDVARFNDFITDRRGAWLHEADPNRGDPAALDLYRGELLQDYYDDWITPRREYFRAAYVEELLALTQEMRTRSDYTSAVGFAQRALEVDPVNERAHQHLMFCHLASGKRSEALQQYEICKRQLEEELAAEPSRETTALYRWIKGGPANQTAPEASITNLPIPLSTFIGREGETAHAKRLLRSGQHPSPRGDDFPATPMDGVRLLTLTGPGGSGKTRLAIQVAADLMDVFPDGVWWVELAASNDGVHVPKAIANALGIRESPDEPLIATLITFLRARRLLLILDNCEHLITACAIAVDQLLNQCRKLKVVVTSRQALGLIGEYAISVPSLSLPPRAQLTRFNALLSFEAIRLFVERAQALNPGFALTDKNAASVLQICTRLDGIPLAIELAAMWTKTLSVEEIAGRLDDRFNLLMMGSRTAPPRHQTLRNVLDWSYNLLSDVEQVMLRRLSVFAGGCTLDTVQAIYRDEAVPGSTGKIQQPYLWLDTLNRLVDKSLLIVETPQNQARYHMLETIREYAREKLQAAGETVSIRDRHLDLYVSLAQEAESKLRSPEQSRWLDILDRELDNLRSALEWSLTHDSQRGLRLAGALVWYWNLGGHWSEGPVWLNRLLTLPDAAAQTPARAAALVAAANLSYWGSSDYVAARGRLEEAVAIYRALSPASRWGLGDALSLYGELLRELGESARAEAALEESDAIGRELGEDGKWIRAWALMSLGYLADSPATARQRLEQSAALSRQTGDRAQLPVVLARLAWFHMGQGDYPAAEANARESLILTEAIGDVMGAAWMLKLDGDLALAQSDYSRAAAGYSASLERFRMLGSKAGIAEALLGLGQVLQLEGNPDGMRRAWEEALPLFEEMEQKSTHNWLRDQLEGVIGES